MPEISDEEAAKLADALTKARNHEPRLRLYVLSHYLIRWHMVAEDSAEEIRRMWLRSLQNQMQDWSDEERVAPENWVFNSVDAEANDGVWEFGVSGFTGTEKWRMTDQQHWLLPLGRILELRSDGLLPLLCGHDNQQQICGLLALYEIKKVQIELKIPQSEFDALGKILAGKGIALEYCG